MESLAALSLAGNVLQFIEFSSELVRDAASVYRSASGLPAELQDMAIITENLASHMNRLSAPAIKPNSSVNEQALVSLAKNCQATCSELQQLVEGIRGKTPRSRGNSFLVTWKALRRKGELERLEKRLDRYRSQILSHIVSMLR